MKKEQILKLLKMGIIIFAIIVAFEILFSIDFITDNLQIFFNKMAGFGYFVMFLLQFLQVCFIPVPSYFITLAGIKIYNNPSDCVTIFTQQINMKLFAITMSAYMLGVLVAYFVGMKWGKKAVLWAAGSEEDYQKWCKVFKTKRSIIVYFCTVLFPIFPDDILCYIAGSVRMNFGWYFIANLIGRAIGLLSFMFVFQGGKDIVELIVMTIVFVAFIIAYYLLKYKYKDKNKDKIKEGENMSITSKELREKWLRFYEERGHKNIGAVSLIGDGTTGVMFNVAGMQPLMPYLLGKKHPDGTRLCNVQGCVRTVDIESVGDCSHHTFFEMMGNWSLGDYFKKEKTKWTFDLLTKEFGLDKDKICCTVFAGNESVPKDEETANYLIELGIKPENIYYLSKDDNWWELEGTVNTPCGPDNEWFYPRNDNKCCDTCDINCSCGRYVEIGNDVYMQYRKTETGYEPLENKNVDTGFGFERMLMFLNGFTDSYKTDLFTDVIHYLEKESGFSYNKDEDKAKAMRVIADHIRTSVMLIGDENSLLPSNVGAGYILRRLLRRAVRYAKQLKLDTSKLKEVAKIFIEKVYYEAYPRLHQNEEYILTEIEKEITKFEKTLEQGLKEFEKVIEKIEKHKEFAKNNNETVENIIGGKACFRLYDTFGFPVELTQELALEKGYEIDRQGFDECFKEHQEKSKATPTGEFKSGLKDTSVETTKYHTATHLLNAALKLVIGKESHQMGSNITNERLRFDFPCDHKLTKEEIAKIEEIVNGWIKDGLKVSYSEMPKEKAVEIGAEHQFIERYPDIVTVYTIGDVSKEICTGPHVKNTSELGKFKIVKEEASSSGVRRIKAILE